MNLPGLTLSETEVSQEFDLNQILGMDISGDEGLQEAVGQAIIDRIVDRTGSGRGVDGKALAKYSESYKQSLEFKAYGKTSKVNMELTGDMLGTLTITANKKGKIKVGWSDSENNAKAYGHITGMKGHPWLDGVTPARNFFGLTKAEINSLREEFRPNNRKSQKKNDDAIIAKLNKLMGAA